MKTKMKSELEWYQDFKEMSPRDLKRAGIMIRVFLFLFKKPGYTLFIVLMPSMITWVPLFGWITPFHWTFYAIFLVIIAPFYVEFGDDKDRHLYVEEWTNALRAWKDIENEQK